MAQKGFDILRETTDSRYRLSMVVGRRAAQLKLGVPSTLTHKVVPKGENAVSAAMAELESGSGVIWGDSLPSAEDIGRQVERDLRRAEEAPGAYSILRDARGEEGEPGPGAF